jgi:REP-associated tyrosine transposase
MVEHVARRARALLPELGLFHVNNRGVEKRPIFMDDDDRRFFLALYRMARVRYRWNVLAYCLMTNHFHFVIDGRRDDVSVGMHFLAGRYAQAFNARHTRVGHLFQDRFHARLVEEEAHRETVCDYVFDNPVRAGLCSTRDEWSWLGGSAYAPA